MYCTLHMRKLRHTSTKSAILKIGCFQSLVKKGRALNPPDKLQFLVQSGVDPWNALGCRSFFGKRATNYRALCGKCPVKIRHLGLRHPVECTNTRPWGRLSLFKRKKTCRTDSLITRILLYLKCSVHILSYEHTHAYSNYAHRHIHTQKLTRVRT